MDAQQWLEKVRANSEYLRHVSKRPIDIPTSDYQRKVDLVTLADSVARLIRLIEQLSELDSAPPHWSRLRFDILPDLRSLLSDSQEVRTEDFPKHTRFVAEHIVSFLDSLHSTKPTVSPEELKKPGAPPKPLTPKEKKALDLYVPDDPQRNREEIYRILGLLDKKAKADRFNKLLDRKASKEYLESKQKN